MYGNDNTANTGISTISKAEKVMDAFQLIARQVAKRIPIPQVQLVENFMGKGGLVTSLGDLFDKIENKTAKVSDYGQVVADVLIVVGTTVVLAGGSPTILAAATMAGIATAVVKYFPESKEWLKEHIPTIGNWLENHMPDWVSKADYENLNPTQLAELKKMGDFNASDFQLATANMPLPIYLQNDNSSLFAAAEALKERVTDKVTLAVNGLCDERNFTDETIRGNLCSGMTVVALKADFTGLNTIHAALNHNDIHLMEESQPINRYAKADSGVVGRTAQVEHLAEIAAFEPSAQTLGIDSPMQQQSQSRARRI
jgi:hypothetical protein